ncbi:MULTISPECIES: hypothetical protein [Sinomonas]|nr:hypothetical protein [Sinomonas atrocyanea]
MSDSEEHRPPSWWSTLPGILTGVAALITALAGLFFGLVQLNSQGTAATTVKSSAAANPARPAQSSIPETAIASAPPAAVQVTNQPQRVGDLEYTVVSASARPDADGLSAIEFTVRCFNYGRYDANFWDAGFRVAAGSDVYSPTSGLDVVVPSDSSTTGVVRFVVPASARSLTLTFRFPAGERSVPVSLS